MQSKSLKEKREKTEPKVIEEIGPTFSAKFMELIFSTKFVNNESANTGSSLMQDKYRENHAFMLHSQMLRGKNIKESPEKI